MRAKQQIKLNGIKFQGTCQSTGSRHQHLINNRLETFANRENKIIIASSLRSAIEKNYYLAIRKTNVFTHDVNCLKVVKVSMFYIFSLKTWC
jgi:hypothetical protein